MRVSCTSVRVSCTLAVLYGLLCFFYVQTPLLESVTSVPG